MMMSPGVNFFLKMLYFYKKSAAPCKRPRRADVMNLFHPFRVQNSQKKSQACLRNHPGNILKIKIHFSAPGLAFLWDMNNTKWYNGFYIQFIQSFAKKTFSYGENLKS